jgi:hypothetical protein
MAAGRAGASMGRQTGGGGRERTSWRGRESPDGQGRAVAAKPDGWQRDGGGAGARAGGAPPPPPVPGLFFLQCPVRAIRRSIRAHPAAMPVFALRPLYAVF